jgi:hypothetical protein
MPIDAYSILLGLALASGVGSVVLAAYGGRSRPRTVAECGTGGSWTGIRGAARAAALVAVILASASAATHALTGHGPRGADPLGLMAFVWAHPALLVSLAIGVAGLFLCRGRPPAGSSGGRDSGAGSAMTTKGRDREAGRP